jgi:hypothetical protein
MNDRKKAKEKIIKEKSNLRSVQDASFETRIAEQRSADLSHELQLLILQERSRQSEALEKEKLDHWILDQTTH